MDNDVILEPGKNERFLTSEETLLWLENCLKDLEKLPKDLKSQGSLKTAAKHLLDTACDLEIRPGFNVQWFAVRMDPSGQSK